jgi:putative modified peptide
MPTNSNLEALFDKLANDDGFRSRLEANPAAALGELGIEVPAAMKNETVTCPARKRASQARTVAGAGARCAARHDDLLLPEVSRAAPARWLRRARRCYLEVRRPPMDRSRSTPAWRIAAWLRGDGESVPAARCQADRHRLRMKRG